MEPVGTPGVCPLLHGYSYNSCHVRTMLLPLFQGSSAGAGSEVFHVYRHLRRKEMLRQDWIQEHAKEEELEKEFEERRAENLAIAENKTAKKRAKRYSSFEFLLMMLIFNYMYRQRKKQKQSKQVKTDGEVQNTNKSERESSSDSDDPNFTIGEK